uniref:Uncharacterized protein n=1 Tax=Candidatus Methanogaster sp. ANME-2c ERB4 TaxID=2759911 RepID=A0A7G9Y121_9EURY|nr:hypothetical protein NEBFCOPL_00006 [Methanosarcinales archaeon ANME-2c ERB4]
MGCRARRAGVWRCAGWIAEGNDWGGVMALKRFLRGWRRNHGVVGAAGAVKSLNIAGLSMVSI